MVLGTHQGVVLCLDLIGKELLRYNAHTMKVNAVSIDQTGKFIGSCSEDGTVCVQTVGWRPDANGHAAVRVCFVQCCCYVQTKLAFKLTLFIPVYFPLLAVWFLSNNNICSV